MQKAPMTQYHRNVHQIKLNRRNLYNMILFEFLDFIHCTPIL